MNRFRFILALTALAAAIVFYHRTPIVNWAAGEILEVRLQSAVTQIEQTPFEELVSTDVTHQAVQGRSLYAARAAFFDAHLCGPVFDDTHNGRGTCFDVLYARSSTSDVAYWYGMHNIPTEVAPLVAQFRTAMMQRARDYLADPARLVSFYEARKSVAVGYIRGLDTAARAHTLERLIATHAAFAGFYNLDVQEAYARYMEAEDAWRYRPGLKPVQINYERDGYETWMEARERLSAMSPDLAATLFAGRRDSEGGRPLVKAYAAITVDLLEGFLP